MELFPSTILAKRYFIRRGRMFLVAAIVVVLVGICFAPDLLGRAFAGLFAGILGTLGALSLRKARSVGERAIVREHMDGHSVSYTVARGSCLLQRFSRHEVNIFALFKLA